MRKRIDYPDDGSTYARLMTTLADHGRHARHGEHRQAAVTAHQAEGLAEALTNESFDQFDQAQPRQRRSLAAERGISHGTVNQRISRARQVSEELVTATAEQMQARPELVRPALAAITSKKKDGWTVAEITRWMQLNFPDTGFADLDTITRLYDQL